jgi:hypothetical protein
MLLLAMAGLFAMRHRRTRVPEHYRATAGVIRKLKSGQYRLYSARSIRGQGRRRNLGTFGTRAAAEKHERAVQYFKRRR